MKEEKFFFSKWKLTLLFLKLGFTGFGGPVAHIALMREEFVVKRALISEKEFMDLISASNLIPGPNSTELAMHIGHKTNGFVGLLIAGFSFILPAFMIVLSISVAYVEYGHLPQVASIFYGMRPAIFSIVMIALLSFKKAALVKGSQFLIFFLALVLLWFGVNQVLVLLLSCLINIRSLKKNSFFPIFILSPKAVLTTSSQSLFFYFFKIGSVLFGSGYVLFAFLKEDLVDHLKWITSQQLIDAISVGQITPGPLFTSATFIGYLLAGFEGASLATIGIFLPAFIFVALSAPYLNKLKENNSLRKILDSVNAASFALLVMASFELGKISLISFPSVFIFIFSFLILKFSKLNSFIVLFITALLGHYFF